MDKSKKLDFCHYEKIHKNQEALTALRHRSDSNQGSDYIAIFSLISSSGGQNFKNKNGNVVRTLI